MRPILIFARMSGPDRSDSGNAIVETLVLMPLMVLVLLGVFDFGRLFYAVLAVTHAARAGAGYGRQSTGKSGDFAGMEAEAQVAAQDVAPVTATATRFCECSDGSSIGCTSLPECADGNARLVYVSVTVSKLFTGLSGYAGLPASFNISRTATLRAQ